MSFSTQSVTSDGSLVLIDISFDYITRDEVAVFFDSVPTTDWSWVGDNEKKIAFSPAVPDGVEVLVKRTTDISKLRHEFSLGAAFIYQTLDEDLKQVLHIAQEASEANFVGDFFAPINMHTNRITSLAAGTAPTDAANVGQLGPYVATAAAAAASASDSATNAAISATQAAISVAALDSANIVRTALLGVYPVGSLYFNGSAGTNPATLFGFGTWVPFGVGRVPVSLNAYNPIMDAAGKVFGLANASVVAHGHTFTGTNANTGTESADHTHAVSDPGHAHTIAANTSTGSVIGSTTQANGVLSSLFATSSTKTTGISLGTQTANHTHNITPAGTISTTGVSGTNLNYQPSIAVYIWMRTA